MMVVQNVVGHLHARARHLLRGKPFCLVHCREFIRATTTTTTLTDCPCGPMREASYITTRSDRAHAALCCHWFQSSKTWQRHSVSSNTIACRQLSGNDYYYQACRSSSIMIHSQCITPKVVRVPWILSSRYT